MRARRVHLIEAVDAAGAHARDARARVKALVAAGCETCCAAVEPLRDGALHLPAAAAGDTLQVRADLHGRHLLRRWLCERPADLVLVAAAVAGGGEAGRWLDRVPGVTARWWPTGVDGSGAAPNGAARAASMGSMRRPGALPPLAIEPAVAPPAGIASESGAGLDASVLADARPTRGQLPLWDGDYVLVPAALAGAAGRAVIDAFATICAGHDGLDLVVLADPQPAFERMARARGIGFRVHFAGEAPRDAELAWLSAAAATVIGGDAPLSAGLILRALARGCPVLAAGDAPPAMPLEAWLAARGLAVGPAESALASRLERAVARDPAWRVRARAAVADHDAAAVGGRLATALDAALDGRRAA